MIFDNDLGEVCPPPLPIIVAKFDKETRAVFACSDWVGVRTHWYGNHTIACCQTEDCPACGVGQQWTKKLYIVARSCLSQNLAILMITPVAAQVIVKWRSRECGLLGMEVILGRAAKRNTAPMTARVIGSHKNVEPFGQKKLERVVQRIFAANARLKS